MAKQRPEENPPERRVLPMDLHVGDRLTDETGEYGRLACRQHEP
jgi:hypothetical protein